MNNSDESISQHRLKLAKDLVDDIELSRLLPEQLLLKATRLARLMEDKELDRFLWYELNGYQNTEDSWKFMDSVGRWIDKPKNEGYWGPLATINNSIIAYQVQLQLLRIPDVQVALSSSNPNEFVTGGPWSLNKPDINEPIASVLARQYAITSAISGLSGVRSRVLAKIHYFAANTFLRLSFSGVAESIFQKNQVLIDSFLREVAPEVLEKIPSINDRLAEGDPEAISQAMTSCRRMISAIADSLYPPSDNPLNVEGQDRIIDSAHYLNRLKLFLEQHCKSSSRRDRLKRTLSDLNEKSSAGIHSDVTSGEAKSLFLLTYLTLGEVAQIAQKDENESGK